jgi:D-arabinose 1-dehydrogenase-like Zn-dependent alcohol dehydrogenase
VKGCCAFTRQTSEELARFMEEHDIKPVIAKEYGFEDAVEAFEGLQKQDAVGKIVIKISDE